LCFCGVNTLFAKILEVRNDFRAGSFASIREAVENAQAGDTIFLYPKNGSNDPWVAPNIFIEKPLTFLGPQNGKLKIAGTLKFKLSNNVFEKLNLNNIEGDGLQISSNWSSGNKFFEGRLTNCKFNSVTVSQVFVEFLGCELNGIVFNSFGLKKIIGCQIKDIYLSTSAGYPYSDTLVVIGNRFTEKFNATFYGKWIFCSNNYFQPSSSGGQLVIRDEIKYIVFNNLFDYQNIYGSFINIDNNGYQDSLYNLNFNNIFILSPYYSNNYFYDCLFKNNLVIIPGRSENFLGNNFISHTVYHGGNQKISDLQYYNKAIGNQKASGGQVITPDSLGQVFDSTYTINKGIDWPAFSDVDLTRNDIGPSGGPFPISNFWGPAAGKASVYWVDLPWRVLGGNTPIQIKAKSGSK
jgi:hypothetical protein